MKKQNYTRYIVTGALIAALYVGLTLLANMLNLAYGPIQFRISEALTVLPVFTPAAIPGLAIGCLISNIFSFNAIDMVFGTMATLIASVLTYLFRNIKFKNLPLLSLLPPVIINAIIIGLELSFFYLDGMSFAYGFVISAIQVGIGELVVCYGLGIPLYLAIKKRKIHF